VSEKKTDTGHRKFSGQWLLCNIINEGAGASVGTGQPGAGGPSMPRLRLLFVRAEAYPLAKTGGLADVCAALPAALARAGVDVRLMLPGYRSALDGAVGKQDLGSFAGGGRLLHARMPDSGLPVYLFDHPDLFRRDGGLYQDPDRRGWPDNHLRFAAFCRAAAWLALHGDGAGWRPQLVHAHDWHTGLVPALLALEGPTRPPSVLTVHNLAFQGNFPRQATGAMALPAALCDSDAAEFYGQFSFLKVGISYADRLTTVSPTYAQEILTPEHGAGLDGLLRKRAADLVGILNGVDGEVWDPETDAHLAHHYSRDDLSGKRACKAAIQQELGLEPSEAVPLICFLNRLTHQKMADVVLAMLPALAEVGCQFALHGKGDRDMESAFAAAAERSPRVAVRIGYREDLAHRLNAGADISLTPSRFEPCGLTTMYAMRYGTLPVTRPVGGLADTVVDSAGTAADDAGATGFTFAEPSAEGLLACLGRAAGRFRDKAAWRRLQHTGMTRDFGWDASARRYLAVYHDLLPETAWPADEVLQPAA
jgi:starch synthase